MYLLILKTLIRLKARNQAYISYGFTFIFLMLVYKYLSDFKL